MGDRMVDREKVIDGLVWCMNEEHDCYREKGCPYENEGEDVGCKYALHRDAIALLKAQEPSVLSLEEARDFFVIEYRYSGKIRKIGDELTVDDDCRDYYNRVWRIWDHMPTDEERRAAPWT